MVVLCGYRVRGWGGGVCLDVVDFLVVVLVSLSSGVGGDAFCEAVHFWCFLFGVRFGDWGL